MNLRSNLDDLIRLCRVQLDPAPRKVSILSALKAVLSSTEGLGLLAIAGLFLAGQFINVDSDSSGVVRFALWIGVTLILAVLLSWAFRTKKWIEQGIIKELRVRKAVPSRGAESFWIWVEDLDGNHYSPSFQAGSWASSLAVGAFVQVLVAPDSPTVFFIPTP